MTLEELQRIVVKLSSQVWTRYFVQANCPSDLPLMGIAVYNALDDFDRLNRELTDLGFTHSYNEWSFDLWTIPRVNEDGTPFK